jgi:hypothetical protein
MNNRILSIFATLICSVTWVATLIALPFAEEYFSPSGSNDSWQRGLVVTPFVIAPVLVVFHFVCKKAVAAGHVSFYSFVFNSSLYGLLLFLSLGLPVFVVSLVIGLISIVNLFVVSCYLMVAAYLTLLPSLSLWWLIVLSTHKQSSKKGAVNGVSS